MSKLEGNQNEFHFRGWARILLLILPYFFIVAGFQFIGYAIGGVPSGDSNYTKSFEQHLIISFFGLLGTFLVLWILMKYIDREKFIDLGFSIRNRFMDFAVGTVVGLITMIFGFVLLIGIDEINYSRFVFDLKDLFISVLLFLIVAVVEEALYRGYILKNLMLSCNKYVALIISSVIFSLMHGANPNMSVLSFFGLFCAGIILGITYVYTKNLWYPIGLHFGWNFFQTHLGFNVSGKDFYSLIEFNYTTGNLFNGGEFGFEGSVFSVAAQILIFVGAFAYYHRPSKKNLAAKSGF